MFESIVLPQVVGIGVFDASQRFRGVKETKDRGVAFFEIDFAVENGGYAYIDGKKISITKNILICAKPGSKRHTVLPYRCFYIHMAVKGGALYSCLMQCPDSFLPRNPERIKKLFLNLVNAYNFPDDKSELCIAENLFALCRIVSEEVGNLIMNNSLKNRVGNPEIIESAVKYISENYSDKLTLEKISSCVNLSPTYFHKLFLKAVGCTPNEYLLEIRIRAAKSLLMTTDMPLVNIAAECGFTSQSYFNYAFRRSEGMTPKNYRSSKNSEYLTNSGNVI